MAADQACHPTGKYTISRIRLSCTHASVLWPWRDGAMSAGAPCRGAQFDCIISVCLLLCLRLIRCGQVGRDVVSGAGLVDQQYPDKTDDVPAQRAALLSLYSVTSGDQWVYESPGKAGPAGWSWSSRNSSYCRWPGVMCCKTALQLSQILSDFTPHAASYTPLSATDQQCVNDRDVLGLFLSGAGLSGTLPKQMSALTGLQILLLGQNPGLAGVWPASLEPLGLQVLDVQNTSLLACQTEPTSRQLSESSCQLPAWLEYSTLYSDSMPGQIGMVCPRIFLSSTDKSDASLSTLWQLLAVEEQLSPGGAVSCSVGFFKAAGCSCAAEGHVVTAPTRLDCSNAATNQMPEGQLSSSCGSSAQWDSARAIEAADSSIWICAEPAADPAVINHDKTVRLRIIILLTALPILVLATGYLVFRWRKASLKASVKGNTGGPAGGELTMQAKRSRFPGTPSIALTKGRGVLAVSDVMVTWVVTDVEGSTQLWEWNPAVMGAAVEQHNVILRGLLEQHGGHEVRTDGDSFTLAFHDAADAVAYCIQAQQQLLEVPWPGTLLEHPYCAPVHLGEACIVKHPEAAAVVKAVGGESLEKQGPLIMAGLRVRMGINTGVPDDIFVHDLTEHVEYRGEEYSLTDDIAGMAAGGQILMGPKTFQRWNRIFSQSAMPAEAEPAEEAMNVHYSGTSVPGFGAVASDPAAAAASSRQHSSRWPSHPLHRFKSSIDRVTGSGLSARLTRSLLGFGSVVGLQDSQPASCRITSESVIHRPPGDFEDDVVLSGGQTLLLGPHGIGTDGVVSLHTTEDSCSMQRLGSPVKHSSEEKGCSAAAAKSAEQGTASAAEGAAPGVTAGNKVLTHRMARSSVGGISFAINTTGSTSPAAAEVGKGSIFAGSASAAGAQASTGGPPLASLMTKRSSLGRHFAHAATGASRRSQDTEEAAMPPLHRQDVQPPWRSSLLFQQAAPSSKPTTAANSNLKPDSADTTGRPLGEGVERSVGSAFGRVASAAGYMLFGGRSRITSWSGDPFSGSGGGGTRTESSMFSFWDQKRGRHHQFSSPSLVDVSTSSFAASSAVLLDLGYYQWKPESSLPLVDVSGMDEDEAAAARAAAQQAEAATAAAAPGGLLHLVQVQSNRLAPRMLLFEWPLPAAVGEDALLQQLLPGFLDAPGASSLMYPSMRALLDADGAPAPAKPSVAIAFVKAAGLKEAQAFGPEIAQACQSLYTSIVREVLLAVGGYESKEVEGQVMAAFHGPRQAVEWALALQCALLQAPWPTQLEQLQCATTIAKRNPAAAPTGNAQYHMSLRSSSTNPQRVSTSRMQQVPLIQLQIPSQSDHGPSTSSRGSFYNPENVFRGIRACVGIWSGPMDRVLPHGKSGRADYLGPPANRAARLMGAAQGGQIMVEEGIMQTVLQEWQDIEARGHQSRCSASIVGTSVSISPSNSMTSPCSAAGALLQIPVAGSAVQPAPNPPPSPRKGTALRSGKKSMRNKLLSKQLQADGAVYDGDGEHSNVFSYEGTPESQAGRPSLFSNVVESAEGLSSITSILTPRGGQHRPRRPAPWELDPQAPMPSSVVPQFPPAPFGNTLATDDDTLTALVPATSRMVVELPRSHAAQVLTIAPAAYQPKRAHKATVDMVPTDTDRNLHRTTSSVGDDIIVPPQQAFSDKGVAMPQSTLRSSIDAAVARTLAVQRHLQLARASSGVRRSLDSRAMPQHKEAGQHRKSLDDGSWGFALRRRSGGDGTADGRRLSLNIGHNVKLGADDLHEAVEAAFYTASGPQPTAPYRARRRSLQLKQVPQQGIEQSQRWLSCEFSRSSKSASDQESERQQQQSPPSQQQKQPITDGQPQQYSEQPQQGLGSLEQSFALPVKPLTPWSPTTPSTAFIFSSAFYSSSMAPPGKPDAALTSSESPAAIALQGSAEATADSNEKRPASFEYLLNPNKHGKTVLEAAINPRSSRHPGPVPCSLAADKHHGLSVTVPDLGSSLNSISSSCAGWPLKQSSAEGYEAHASNLALALPPPAFVDSPGRSRLQQQHLQNAAVSQHAMANSPPSQQATTMRKRPQISIIVHDPADVTTDLAEHNTSERNEDDEVQVEEAAAAAAGATIALSEQDLQLLPVLPMLESLANVKAKRFERLNKQRNLMANIAFDPGEAWGLALSPRAWPSGAAAGFDSGSGATQFVSPKKHRYTARTDSRDGLHGPAGAAEAGSSGSSPLNMSLRRGAALPKPSRQALESAQAAAYSRRHTYTEGALDQLISASMPVSDQSVVQDTSHSSSGGAVVRPTKAPATLQLGAAAAMQDAAQGDNRLHSASGYGSRGRGRSNMRQGDETKVWVLADAVHSLMQSSNHYRANSFGGSTQQTQSHQSEATAQPKQLQHSVSNRLFDANEAAVGAAKADHPNTSKSGIAIAQGSRHPTTSNDGSAFVAVQVLRKVASSLSGSGIVKWAAATLSNSGSGSAGQQAVSGASTRHLRPTFSLIGSGAAAAAADHLAGAAYAADAAIAGAVNTGAEAIESRFTHNHDGSASKRHTADKFTQDRDDPGVMAQCFKIMPAAGDGNEAMESITMIKYTALKQQAALEDGHFEAGMSMMPMLAVAAAAAASGRARSTSSSNVMTPGSSLSRLTSVSGMRSHFVQVNVHIVVHRVGGYRLKGVDKLVDVVQVLPAGLENRLQHLAPPKAASKGKSRCVAPASGLFGKGQTLLPDLTQLVEWIAATLADQIGPWDTPKPLMPSFKLDEQQQVLELPLQQQPDRRQLQQQHSMQQQSPHLWPQVQQQLQHQQQQEQPQQQLQQADLGGVDVVLTGNHLAAQHDGRLSVAAPAELQGAADNEQPKASHHSVNTIKARLHGANNVLVSEAAMPPKAVWPGRLVKQISNQRLPSAAGSEGSTSFTIGAYHGDSQAFSPVSAATATTAAGPSGASSSSGGSTSINGGFLNAEWSGLLGQALQTISLEDSLSGSGGAAQPNAPLPVASSGHTQQQYNRVSAAAAAGARAKTRLHQRDSAALQGDSRAQDDFLGYLDRDGVGDKCLPVNGKQSGVASGADAGMAATQAATAAAPVLLGPSADGSEMSAVGGHSVPVSPAGRSSFALFINQLYSTSGSEAST